MNLPLGQCSRKEGDYGVIERILRRGDVQGIEEEPIRRANSRPWVLAYHATFPKPFSRGYLFNPYLADLGLLGEGG